MHNYFNESEIRNTPKRKSPVRKNCRFVKVGSKFFICLGKIWLLYSENLPAAGFWQWNTICLLQRYSVHVPITLPTFELFLLFLIQYSSPLSWDIDQMLISVPNLGRMLPAIQHWTHHLKIGFLKFSLTLHHIFSILIFFGGEEGEVERRR